MIGLILAAALAAMSPCATHCAGGIAPMAPGVTETADYTGFSIGYVPAWGEPAWSAQEMTAESARAGEAVKRAGSFHPCVFADGTQSISPSIYAGAGEDMGHMTEAAARGPDKAETFVTCNSVAQEPNLNRKIWRLMEASIRKLAESGEHLWIVTGPYVAPDATMIKGKLAKPAATWKAIYDVGKGAEAWWCSNTSAPDCKQIPIMALEVAIGFDPFPGVDPTLLMPIELPAPTKGAN